MQPFSLTILPPCHPQNCPHQSRPLSLLGPSLHDIQLNTRALRRGVKELCKELLLDAIGLMDGFGLLDWEIDRCMHAFLSCNTDADADVEVH